MQCPECQSSHIRKNGINRQVTNARFFKYDKLEKTNYQYIILEIEPEKAGLTRDKLMQVLYAHNVRARRYFYLGCHKSEPDQTLYPEQLNSLPNTDLLCNRVLCLPTGQAISVSDLDKICQIIKQALRG